MTAWAPLVAVDLARKERPLTKPECLGAWPLGAWVIGAWLHRARPPGWEAAWARCCLGRHVGVATWFDHAWASAQPVVVGLAQGAEMLFGGHGKKMRTTTE
jgi:hypothetical protein